MEKDQAKEFIRWLNIQINHTKDVINESQKDCNYGRESMYEGMRDAFLRCLNKLRTSEE